MRSAILLGLVFIGDNIGRGLGAELKGSPTLVVAAFLAFCLALDVAELVIRARIWKSSK